MLKTIKCILRFHDDLSQKAVFESTDGRRQAYFNQAIAIRGLLEKIRKDVVRKEDQDKFTEIVKEHTEAMSRGLLWNRKVELEDD